MLLLSIISTRRRHVIALTLLPLILRCVRCADAAFVQIYGNFNFTSGADSAWVHHFSTYNKEVSDEPLADMQPCTPAACSFSPRQR